jgi:hypothetical protein
VRYFCSFVCLPQKLCAMCILLLCFLVASVSCVFVEASIGSSGILTGKREPTFECYASVSSRLSASNIPLRAISHQNVRRIFYLATRL